MPQPSHRLFQEKTLSQALKGFLFPADIGDRHHKLLQWVQALESGTFDAAKETSLHGDFLKDVFQDALGDRLVIGGTGNLGPKDFKTLSDACGDYALPIQQHRRDGLVLEHRISELVN